MDGRKAHETAFCLIARLISRKWLSQRQRWTESIVKGFLGLSIDLPW